MREERDRMQGNKVNVLIAGKSPIIRMGLAHALYAEPSLRVIRDFDGLCGVGKEISSAKADVAVIENSFAMWEVVDLIKKLDDACGIPILIVSERCDRLYVSSMLSAGAAGILITKEPSDHLVAAIRKIISGGTYLSETLSQKVMEATGENNWGGHLGIEQLSDRELQLLELMGMGYNTNEIGKKLHIGTKTVETHRRHIRQKLGSQNTSELLRRAISWVVQSQPQLSSCI